MSDASPPSPPAANPSPDPNDLDNDLDNENNNSDGPSESPRANGSRSESRSRRRRKRKSKTNGALAKKLQFMTDLLKGLDSLVFVELAVLYYMECSLARFCIRAVPHYMFLTPKSDSLPIVLRAPPSHVVSILIPNMICLLIHLFMTLPTGSELTRGHLHGGILIDFIGQKPPTTRLVFFILDVGILIMQGLMLAVHADRETLKDASTRPEKMLEILAALDRQAQESRTQDEAERGDSQSALQGLLNETVEMEMRSLRRRLEREERNTAAAESTAAATASTGGVERDPEDNAREGSSLMGDSTAASTAPPAVGRRQLADMYASGNAMIGNFHVLHSLRTASTDYGPAAAQSIRTLGYATALAAYLAQQRGQTLGRSQG